jgi:hypothetical protein
MSYLLARGAQASGDYCTKRVILEIYAAMAESIRTGRENRDSLLFRQCLMVTRTVL